MVVTSLAQAPVTYNVHLDHALLRHGRFRMLVQALRTYVSAERALVVAGLAEDGLRAPKARHFRMDTLVQAPPCVAVAPRVQHVQHSPAMLKLLRETRELRRLNAIDYLSTPSREGQVTTSKNGVLVKRTVYRLWSQPARVNDGDVRGRFARFAR